MTAPDADRPSPRTAGPASGADPTTIEVYESAASAWAANRRPASLAAAQDLAGCIEGDARPRADLGCGPGWHLAALGDPAIAVDAARSMLDLVADQAPDAVRVQADLTRLPFARGALAAAFATRSHVHIDAPEVPRSLADLHHALAPGAPISLALFASGDSGTEPTQPFVSFRDDPFPGRRFSLWNVEHLRDVLTGAGFIVDALAVAPRTDAVPDITVSAHRTRTLPDTVGRGMRMLVCGLNPSLHAADAGIGFVTPGNRFWPAAIAAGLVSVDRDPFHALDRHGIGMTDLAKRATRRADELAKSEYADGLTRMERLSAWLEPQVICFVGLAGYRAARDRHAVAGPQAEPLGGRPVYVMPSTSGLNAHSRLHDLTDHLLAALRLAG